MLAGAHDYLVSVVKSPEARLCRTLWASVYVSLQLRPLDGPWLVGVLSYVPRRYGP